MAAGCNRYFGCALYKIIKETFHLYIKKKVDHNVPKHFVINFVMWTLQT